MRGGNKLKQYELGGGGDPLMSKGGGWGYFNRTHPLGPRAVDGFRSSAGRTEVRFVLQSHKLQQRP